MSPAVLVDVAREALLLALTLSVPLVAAAAVVGFGVALLQAATQVQEPTLPHLPKLVAVAVALVVLGPWIGREIGSFTEHVFVAAAAR